MTAHLFDVWTRQLARALDKGDRVAVLLLRQRIARAGA
jgi:hypothetical protein